MHRALLVVLLGCLVALAGCGAILPGGGSPSDPRTTSTATPAPVPDVGATSLPPGVRPDGVNATVLARTTARSVRGETVRFQFDEREARPEFSLGTVYVGPRVTVESVAPRRYTVRVEEVNERGGGLSVETFENATYATPERVYRYDGANLTTVRDERARGRPARLVAGYVGTYLDVETVQVRRLGDGRVSIEGEGGPSVNGTDYSVRAVVGPDGVVQSFEGIYTRDGRVQFATFSLTEGGVFTPPEWFDESRVTGTSTPVGTSVVTATGTETERTATANGTATAAP